VYLIDSLLRDRSAAPEGGRAFHARTFGAHELEFGDLPLGLAVGPWGYDSGADSLNVASDTT
jgi:hypothetical protein